MSALRRAVVTFAAVAAIAVAAAACGGDEPSPSPLVNLAGTWTAVTISGQPVGAISPPQIQFTVDGHVVGASFCNDLSGPVQVSGNRIAVGPLDHKQTDCPAFLVQLDTLFVTALRSAETISGGHGAGQLVLNGPAGEIVFTDAPPGGAP